VLSFVACSHEAGIKTAGAVMLGVHEKLGSVESDAMVLAGLLQVCGVSSPVVLLIYLRYW
jgi:hypothetical protein